MGEREGYGDDSKRFDDQIIQGRTEQNWASRPFLFLAHIIFQHLLRAPVRFAFVQAFLPLRIDPCQGQCSKRATLCRIDLTVVRIFAVDGVHK